MRLVTSRGSAAQARIDALGITKVEFADRAKVDRSTVDRALVDDPRVRPSTWAKIERALDDAEDEVGMAESGQLLTSTVEFGGATITLKGSPEEVAAAIRNLLGRGGVV